MCAGELCCLGQRRRVSASCLLYNVYHRADYPFHKHWHHLVAAHNIKASAALSKLTLMVSPYRTDQFSRSFLPAAVSMWNLLLSSVFSGGTLSYFKSAMNMRLQRT